jgi:hypothetical protein
LTELPLGTPVEDLPPLDYGLVRPIPEDVAEEARNTIVQLIAALAAPFPHARWVKCARADEISWSEIESWANRMCSDPDQSSAWPLKPWREVADRISADPPNECYRMIRTFLALLTTAETFGSPFITLGTLMTIHPLLNALVDFLGSISFLDDDVPEASWDANLLEAVGRNERIFRKVFQINR